MKAAATRSFRFALPLLALGLAFLPQGPVRAAGLPDIDGETVEVVAGEESDWPEVKVGLSGTGGLNIDGGNLSSNTGYIGYNLGSSGSVTVSSGTWKNVGNLYVGDSGSGQM